MAPRCLRIVSIARERGADGDALLRCLGRSEVELVDQDLRIPLSRVLDMWTTAMKMTMAPGLPIAVGARAEVTGYADFGYALYTSRSVEEAMSRLMRYHDVIDSTGRWRFAVEKERVAFVWRREGPRDLGMRAANEQSIATFVGVGRQVLGADVKIDEVTFRHSRPAGALPEHDAHFGCKLRFDAEEDAVVMPKAVVERVPFGSNRLLSEHFLAQLDARLRLVAEDKSQATQVVQTIAALLHDGIPTLAQVAARLETSERTLRRRLQGEAQTFEALLIQIQREQAVACLRQGGSVRHAALAAGFLDASSFTRAFRRWTGRTPSQVRDSKADETT